MTPTLQAILEVSTRIREYEAAADTLTAMARLCTDVQVRASLQQQAEELVHTAGQWRKRQDDELEARELERRVQLANVSAAFMVKP